MSGSFRLAKQVIHQARLKIPPNVQVEKQAEQLVVSGPLGTTRTSLSKLDTTGNTAIQLIPEQREVALASSSKAFFGTIQSLLRNKVQVGQSLLGNKVQGVTRGYLKYLRIQGIGYRASLKDQTVTLKLGFSHDITYTLPPSLRAYLPEPTLLGLYGIDKNQVTQAAANIRALRPPSVYKGKGIMLQEEKLKLKIGKKK